MHGMSVDLPYPSTDGLRPDAESVKILSPAYADRGSELTAILQYVYHSIVFAGLNRKQYARMMVEIAIAEMHHLDLLGGMLYNMGWIWCVLDPRSCQGGRPGKGSFFILPAVPGTAQRMLLCKWLRLRGFPRSGSSETRP